MQVPLAVLGEGMFCPGQGEAAGVPLLRVRTEPPRSKQPHSRTPTMGGPWEGDQVSSVTCRTPRRDASSSHHSFSLFLLRYRSSSSASSLGRLPVSGQAALLRTRAPRSARAASPRPVGANAQTQCGKREEAKEEDPSRAAGAPKTTGFMEEPSRLAR